MCRPPLLSMPTPPRSRAPLFAFAVALVAVLGFPGTAAPGDGKPAVPVVTSENTPALILPTRAERAVLFAVDAVGVPYRWGGESPSTGFDCSGLVRWAYGRVGIDLPRNSDALYDEGRRVREAGMEPGDILFFEGLGPRRPVPRPRADGACPADRPQRRGRPPRKHELRRASRRRAPCRCLSTSLAA